jgi:hypothetical protein
MADILNDMDLLESSIGSPDLDMVDFLQDSYGAEDDQYGILEAFRARLKAGRIRRLTKRIARIYESGKESRAKKLAARLAKVVAKMQVLDPYWSPSEAVASWTAWGVGEIHSPYVAADEMPDDDDDDDAWLDNLAQGIQGYTSGGYAPGYISTSDPRGYQQGYQQGHMTGQTHTPQAIPKHARPPLQGRAIPKYARPPMRGAIPQAGRPRLPTRRLGRVAPIRSGSPQIRFGEDDAFGLNQSDVFGGIFSLEKRLASKQDAYERALNLGHARRAKNLLKDIQDLQAKMQEMEAMADVSMAAHIEGGIEDSLGLNDLGLDDFNLKGPSDLDEIDVFLQS